MPSGLFPTLPSPKLNRSDIEGYLLNLKNNGYEVFQDPNHDHILILVLDELHKINFNINEPAGDCQIQAYVCSNMCNYRDVENMFQLEAAVESLVRGLGYFQWPSQPKCGRLSTSTPATNCYMISQLVGASRIEAIFDPYLENASLVELSNILSFGKASLATGVRLLGSTKTTGGPNPKYTRAGVAMWFKERGLNGEARVIAQKGEHRRFMLLSGGQSLILGPSLNSIHKNEASHIELDTEDRPFFDQVWASASPVL